MTLWATFCELVMNVGFTPCGRYNRPVAAADLLLAKLRAAKIRPVDLAAALDISKQQASMMLSGQRGIPTWHLDSLAALLHVSVAELFTASDLLRQRPDQASDFDQGGLADAKASPAPSRVLRDLHPDVYQALKDVSVLVGEALARAEGQRLGRKDPARRSVEPRPRRHGGGHR